MSQEIISQELKSLKKKIRKKTRKKKKTLRKWGEVWDVFIERTFLLFNWILNIARVVFNIKTHFPMVVNILCFYAFSTIRGLFPETFFCIKSCWNQKKRPRKLSLRKVGLYFHKLLFQGLFHRTFLMPTLMTLFPKTFFQRTVHYKYK